MFGIGKIIGAAIDVVLVPVDAVTDIVMLPADAMDLSKPVGGRTVARLTKARDKISDAADELAK